MPYSSGQFPPSYKNLPASVRDEAVKILNALLKDGKLDEGVAIATALARAREWAAKHALDDAEVVAYLSAPEGHPFYGNQWTAAQHEAAAEAHDAKAESMGRGLNGEQKKAQSDHRVAATLHAGAATLLRGSDKARAKKESSIAREVSAELGGVPFHNRAAARSISDYQGANPKMRPYIEKRSDVNPKEGKNKYGDVKFADTKNKKYPIDTEEHIRAAWNYIHKGKNAGEYSPADLSAIKGHIVAAWKAKVDKAGPPSAEEHALLSFDLATLPADDWYVEQFAVAATKYMTRGDVAKKCPDCAKLMAGSGQHMPVDNGGHMNHICGKGGRAVQMSEEQLAEYSNSIKGVEIFSTGKHNGDDYTEQDLDDMVTAFGELDFRPAIKIGHTKDHGTDTPSYGWVRNLRKVGSKLVADFEDMHDSVVDALRKREYDRVSSEVYFNLRRAAKDGVEKVYRRALKAVALLGAEVPAVANLVPLHKMEFAAAEGSFEGLAVCELQMDVPTQAIVDTLAERVSGLVNLMKEYDMAKNAGAIAALKAKVDDYSTKLAAMKKKMKDKGMDPEDMEDGGDDEDTEMKETKNAIKALSKDLADCTASIKKLEAEDSNASDVAKLQEQLAKSAEREAAAKEETKKLNERVAAIELDRRNAEIGTRVRACKVPAFRDGLGALYAYALEHASATVKIYSKDKDGKAITADKSLAEVIDGFVSGINEQSEKLFKALAYSGTPQRAEGSESPGDVTDPGAELDAKAKQYKVDHPEVKSYSAAVKAVLTSDKELAARYRAQLGSGQ